MSEMTIAPFGLRPYFSERVWGRLSLEPWFGETGTTERVGEAWLTGPQCVVEAGPMQGKTLQEVVAKAGPELLGGEGGEEFPLLVKLLFPEEKLSVQVHPDDEQAKAAGESRGKTECWYVLEARPGASVALGLKPGATDEQVLASVAAGTMEELLSWLPVEAGDMVFVDAGTVHAIGPGVVLLETQQMSDVTYRMYDYGRPRELHLEQGLRVMRSRTRAGKVKPRTMDGFVRLIEEEYFVVDRFEGNERRSVTMDGPGCLVALSGKGRCVGGVDAVEMIAGHAVVVAAGAEVQVSGEEGFAFLRCMAPMHGSGL